MCEWLSVREWSDVWLQCGGRSLPAHRAVLASASVFLRRLLLSSEPEETPTFIVLPDFDLEAMSSVLYYIYNGEVVIQKQKMEMFMEIVKAMQIFVDEDYLPSACRVNAGVALCSNVNETILDKGKVFSLGSDSEGAFVNIKKGVDIDKCLVRSIHKDVDKRDKLRSDDGTQLSSVRKVELLGDRQKSSFRRDLFIETYPRNGNANGRLAGVLAIPNSHYHDTASVLSTNANDKHLRPDDAPVKMQNSSNVLRPTILDTQNKDSHNLALITEKMNAEYAHLAQFKSITFGCDPRHLYENGFCSWMNFPLNKSQIISSGSNNVPYLDLRRSEPDIVKKYYESSHSISGNSLQERMISTNYFQDQFNFTDSKCNNRMIRDHSSFTSKRAILNQVMESPWYARQPSNYRPSIRPSLTDKPDVQQDSSKENAVNDSNNNPTIPLSPENVDQNLPNISIKVTSISTSEFKCTVCNQVFTDSEALSFHARRHSTPARYSCTECSKSFSQLRNFKYHMSIHRGTREFAATCTVCGKYFNDRGYLSSHMKIHRNRKEYKCLQCPKSFNQRVAYNMHVRIHTGIKPHVCGECGKAFSRKMLLKQHQRTHSGERPYACPHCDKRFADRSNMTLHLRLHSGIKPFSCTLCSKSFTKKHHLKSHLNFHTGSKPYSCPRCKLAFTQSSNMRTHYKRCTAPEVIINAETSSVS